MNTVHPPDASATLGPSVPPLRPGLLHRQLRVYVPPTLVLLAIIAAWELVSDLAHYPAYLLPAPHRVATAMWTERKMLWHATLITVTEMGLGLAIAIAAGLALAFLLQASAVLRRGIYPLLIGSQTVPVSVLAPILTIAFGYSILPKLAVVALVCFFPLVVNTLDGLRSADPEVIWMMRTLDATAWGIFRRVRLPGALPQIFSGARIAATFAAIGAVFGEWSGSTDGLGFLMLQATPQLRTDLVFDAILLLTAASMTLFFLVSLAERVMAPWSSTER
jgi:putative hydroxymethylpyrimidine transport system permease protein